MPDTPSSPDIDGLMAENARLRQELEESRETLRAIRAGEIDAFIVETEKQPTVLTLGSAEQSYQIILGQNPYPAAVVTLDGRILQTNARFDDLTRRDSAREAGPDTRRLHDLTAPVSLPALERLLSAGTERAAEAEVILHNATGQRVPVWFAARPLKGNPAGPCLLLTDLTDERLRDQIVSEEILAQSILEQIADAVVVCDAKGRIRRTSSAVEQLIGGDPIDRDFDDALPLCHQVRDHDEPLHFADILAQPDTRGQEVYFGEAAQRRHLILSTGFLFDADGGVRGAVLTLTDITDRKRVEQALEAADRRKNEFLAILAHELRNPLAPISNGIRLLRAGAMADAARPQVLMLMERQAQNMVRLIDDLMDVSRITRGKIELRKERLRLADTLRVAAETSDPLITKLDHTLTLAPIDEDLWVEGDFTRLTQVFANLLNNAAKYSEPNGRITVSATQVQDRILITIDDTGIGIRPGMLDHIFDMFTQGDDSLERAQGGLGVGLTLVRNLVEMHGGTVMAHSDGLGHGSRFTVNLPAAPSPAAPSTADKSGSASTADTRQTDGLRVLIVEDNPALAQTTGWLVESLGHDYRLAQNGPDALDIAPAFRPDVVMLDIGLPGMSGYDICRAMRRMPELAGTLFIAQTGWGQSEHRQMAADAGFDHHLVKPVDFDRLQALLASHRHPA